jgi:hypothetical protein
MLNALALRREWGIISLGIGQKGIIASNSEALCPMRVSLMPDAINFLAQVATATKGEFFR